jgi:hypothetical protein
MAEMARSLLDYAAPPVARANAPVNRAQPKSLLDYISEIDLLRMLEGTGIPERAAAANDLLNPLAAIPRAQDASQELFAPSRTGMERLSSTGNMLTELAGIAAPIAAAARAGVPAATALMDGLLGGSPTTQAVGDTARGFLADESGALRLPFKADDPAQARGAQIIDMLQSGRAGEITDEMLDMGDPVMNTRLNEYLFKNYDLPMDVVSRMERARLMGLTEDTIHGTLVKTDFTGFKGADRYGNLIGRENYVAPNTVDGQKLAAQFSTGDQGRVLPLRTPKPLDTSMLDDRLRFEQMMDDKNRLNDFRMNGGYKPSGLPSWGAQWAIDTANEAGEKGIRLHERDWVDSTAIFNPKDIRSRFARFDPRLAHLRNLSAGIIPLGLLSMPSNEEQY